MHLKTALAPIRADQRLKKRILKLWGVTGFSRSNYQLANEKRSTLLIVLRHRWWVWRSLQEYHKDSVTLIGLELYPNEYIEVL